MQGVGIKRLITDTVRPFFFFVTGTVNNKAWLSKRHLYTKLKLKVVMREEKRKRRELESC